MRKTILIIVGIVSLCVLMGVIFSLYMLSKTEVIIEEEGILRVKATSEYAALTEKYGEERITVKAFERHMLSEFGFLRQIDEKFTEESGCIIIVEGPNGEGYVYQQDEEFNTIHQITLSQFKEGSKKIDQEILNEFYGSLK